MNQWTAISPEQRFFGQIKKTDSCWEWTGSTIKGYGAMKIGNTLATAFGAHYDTVLRVVRHQTYKTAGAL